MDPAWVTAIVALATAVVAIAGIFLRLAWKAYKNIAGFIVDWNGTPAGRGRPARLGVLERLGKVEDNIIGISQQVHLNSGQSMKDVVTRTEAAVADVKQDLLNLSNSIRGGGGTP